MKKILSIIVFSLLISANVYAHKEHSHNEHSYKENFHYEDSYKEYFRN